MSPAAELTDQPKKIYPPCPKCASRDRHRIKRNFWMRWFKDAQRYRCAACRNSYLAFPKTEEQTSA